MKTAPDTACVVNGGTTIYCEGQPVSRGNLLDRGMPLLSTTGHEVEDGTSKDIKAHFARLKVMS